MIQKTHPETVKGARTVPFLLRTIFILVLVICAFLAGRMSLRPALQRSHSELENTRAELRDLQNSSSPVDWEKLKKEMENQRILELKEEEEKRSRGYGFLGSPP